MDLSRLVPGSDCNTRHRHPSAFHGSGARCWSAKGSRRLCLPLQLAAGICVGGRLRPIVGLGQRPRGPHGVSSAYSATDTSSSATTRCGCGMFLLKPRAATHYVVQLICRYQCLAAWPTEDAGRLGVLVNRMYVYLTVLCHFQCDSA